jgi:hypothetical protein
MKKLAVTIQFFRTNPLLVGALLLSSAVALPSPVRAEDPEPYCPKTCEAYGQMLSSGGVPPGVYFALITVNPPSNGAGDLECMTCPNNPCRWGISSFGFTDPSGQLELWVWRPQGGPVNLGSVVPGRSGRLVANCNANPDFLDCAVMSNGVEIACKTAILDCICPN